MKFLRNLIRRWLGVDDAYHLAHSAMCLTENTTDFVFNHPSLQQKPQASP